MGIYLFPVDLKWSGTSGSPGVNVWGIRTASPPPVTEGSSLQSASDALSSFYAAIMNVFPSTFTASYAGQVTDSQMSGSHKPAGTTWTHSGLDSAGYLPPSCQIAVSLLTAAPGRSGRGRKFFGPLAADTTEGDGTPTAVALGRFTTAFDTLVSASTSGTNGWAVGVYSHKLRTMADITGYSVKDKFAILRSRRD